jgi:hypothetical protein
MPVSLEWDGSAAIRCTAQPPWNWGDVHAYLRRLGLLLDPYEGQQPVTLIVTLHGDLPRGAVAQVRALGNMSHPKVSLPIYVQGVPHDIQAAMGASNGVYRTGTTWIAFTDRA